MWRRRTNVPMKNNVEKNSNGNKQPKKDLIKMSANEDFKEPDDYLAETPEVRIDGCTYRLHDGASLSFATPKLLSEIINNLQNSEPVINTN